MTSQRRGFEESRRAVLVLVLVLCFALIRSRALRGDALAGGTFFDLEGNATAGAKVFGGMGAWYSWAATNVLATRLRA